MILAETFVTPQDLKNDSQTQQALLPWNQAQQRCTQWVRSSQEPTVAGAHKLRYHVKLCNAKLDHENRFQNFYAQSKPKPKRTRTCKSRVSPVSKPSEAVSRQHTHTFRFPVLEPQVSGVNIQSRTIHKQVKRRQNLWFCQVEVNSIPRNVSFK